MKRLFFLFIVCFMLIFSNVVLAENSCTLNYNVTSNIKNNYVIDSNYTSKIKFSLFDNEEFLYCNDEPVEIIDNKFEISIKGLTGKQEFIITNSSNESVTYTYYISNDKGLLEGFVFDELKNCSEYKTYIKTINGISVIYTNKEKHIVNKVEKILSELPQNILVNLKEIKLLPAEHKSGAAGITRYNTITFYNLSKYSTRTIKNIVTHEIAHTWSHHLIKHEILNYSYSDYKLAVNADKKFPSNYAKRNVEAGNYDEDFAESVSFFLIDSESFENKYPARAEYIKNIIKK